MKCKIIQQLKTAEFRRKIGTVLLFIISFLFVLYQLVQRGTMIDISGDASEAWKAITTFGTEAPYPSYVLYKGFAAIYPYVWLYKLALILNVNQFFFVMCYHALLFSYIVFIGIPVLVETLTEYKSKLWQKMLLFVVLYWFWGRYYVLSQLMVDLPSCAYFFMAIHCAVLIEKYVKWKRNAIIILTGLFCGLIANISGQYSISAICIIIFSSVHIWKNTSYSFYKASKIKKCFPMLVGLLIAMFSVGLLKVWFNIKVLEPFAAQGIVIKSGEAWMERALFYMLDIGRKFYGPDLVDPRGNAIVMSIYGDKGQELLEQAAAGQYGWTIAQYFKAFVQYPLDFIMLYLNRFIIMISDDSGWCSLRSLLPSYSMIYLAILTCVKRIKKVRDVFKAKTWLVLACLASIIPTLVMCVEIRVTISFQALFFGVALVGPILPATWNTVCDGVKQCWREKSLCSIMEKGFPWGLFGWLVFCLVCLAYFGAICAGSEMGTHMLYKW